MSIILIEELGIAESDQIDVLICEPEQGNLLGEDASEDDEERLSESLMDFVESTDKIMEEMIVRPNETKRYDVFYTNDLFVIAGFVANDGKSFETVLKFDEESIPNEERSKVLQQKELIDELRDGGM